MKNTCCKKEVRQSKNAFTLAEVLITLAVIGVVAALTLPTLVQSYEEKGTVSKLKKVYSVLDQASRLAIDKNGTPDEWNLVALNDFSSSKTIYDNISPYLNISKTCANEAGCFASNMYKTKYGGNWLFLDDPNTSSFTAGVYKFILHGGASVYIQTRSADCSDGATTGTTLPSKSICAFFGVDLNGAKAPNQFGKDLFVLMLTKYGVLPRGGVYDSATGSNGFETNCLADNAYGWACAAWVIFNENMDYLHCDDLSWEGKHKCK